MRIEKILLETQYAKEKKLKTALPLFALGFGRFFLFCE